jgi:uncharacterized membrane protein YbaN (DUF454 family)
MNGASHQTTSGVLTAAACARPLLAGARWGKAGLGLACFGMGAIGAVVPGLPTTVFLLAGSYLLTRSCPELDRRLRESRLLARYAHVFDQTTPIPPATRRAALSAMWTSIAVSTVLLAWSGASAPLVAVVVAAGIAGTLGILRFRRHL